jgi:hypothetical protein
MFKKTLNEDTGFNIAHMSGVNVLESKFPIYYYLSRSYGNYAKDKNDDIIKRIQSINLIIDSSFQLYFNIGRYYYKYDSIVEFEKYDFNEIDKNEIEFTKSEVKQNEIEFSKSEVKQNEIEFSKNNEVKQIDFNENEVKQNEVSKQNEVKQIDFNESNKIDKNEISKFVGHPIDELRFVADIARKITLTEITNYKEWNDKLSNEALNVKY